MRFSGRTVVVTGAASGIGDLPQLSATVIGATQLPVLSDLPQLGSDILKGQVKGRVVVDVNG